jgi:hypothetical protein
MNVFRSRWRLAFGLAAMLYTLPSDGTEVQEVHVATQYGFGFLPMMVIEREQMFDRRLAGAGQTSAKVRWIVLGAGPR